MRGSVAGACIEVLSGREDGMEEKVEEKVRKNGSGAEDPGREMSLEETFARLDEITQKLEDPKTSLEDSFSLYREGSRLLKKAEQKVDLLDRQVKQLSEDGEITDFE